MGSRSVIELRKERSPHHALADLVMAWAHDELTKEPRYILELGVERRGAKCACICVGCGEPLVAVNAAKTEFIKRPHFRHQEGVEHGDCVVLAARAAALRQLQETGWIDLPRRRVSRNVAGLSGEFYNAWVELPPERLRITGVHYNDRATALFTFEDGRTLQVELTGSPGGFEGIGLDSINAAVLIGVDDPAIAAMNPAEVRKRLTLLPDALCWRSHWEDTELMRQAEEDAREKAKLFLDEVPDGLVLPEGMDNNLKRESILHFVAKNILADEGRVLVPEFLLEVDVATDLEPLRTSWLLEADTLKLDQIELEESHGDIVPDLACKAYPESGGRVYVPTFIEITVSNAIQEERLQRIRAKKCLALEIDLSLAGGRVTRDELRRLVVVEVATKRWLYHPEVEEHRHSLEQQLKARHERRHEVLATPVRSIALKYLEALLASLKDDKKREINGEFGIRLGSATDERLADLIDQLSIHGFPEAGANVLVAAHGILDRILSIQSDEGIGYRLDSGHAVLNAIKQDRSDDRAYHSLYFIAALAYKPVLNQEQQSKLDKWRGDVRSSIQSGETTYLRPTMFDQLLGLLFPEMGDALKKPGATLDGQRHSRARQTHESRGRYPARLVSTQPRSDKASWELKDTAPHEWWLKGRDLQEWKRQNPEWAAQWPDISAPAGPDSDTPPSPSPENTYSRRKG